MGKENPQGRSNTGLLRVFNYIGKFSELSYVIKKPSGQERTAAEWNDVAEATRRRRRIPRAGFFFIQ